MIKYIPGRVIVKADIEGKNWHTFTHGVKIRIERDYNNLDRKHTQQVLGEVVSAENIPAESMILFHHNAIHPVNTINNYSQLSGEEIASGVRLFSFREDECFVWKQYGKGTWKPTKGFAIGLYLFKPYEGHLTGIEPEKIKNILYIASGGRYAGYVCNCLNATGMPIVFVNEKGVEETIIRLRSYDEPSEREEVIAINHELTELVKEGKIWVGTSKKDCKPLNKYYE